MAQDSGVPIKTKIEGPTFSASLQPGFHFNDKAPNLLKADEKRIEPIVVKRQLITFRLPEVYRAAEASLYVCDDQNTVCEPHHIQIKGETAAVGKPDRSTSRRTKNAHGFFETTLDDAKKMAELEKKLILLDFSARWCPGCVRLEQEVFDSKEFKEASKNFVKVKFDVDRFENVEAKKAYAVAGIPTLLVLNSDLKEISRVVDYQPPSAIEKFLQLAHQTPLSFSELKSKADSSDMQAALLLGQREYNAGQYADAVTYLSKVSPTPIELRNAKVQAAFKASEADESKNPKLREVVEIALSEEPSTTRSINWRATLANSLAKGDPEKRKLAMTGLALADTLLADDKKLHEALRGDLVGEFAGFEKFLVAFERADLAEAGELSESEIADANAKVAEIGKQLKIPITRTGPSMRFLLALVGAKDFVAAETQAKKLLAKNPKSPELERRLVKILNENKKYYEAVKMGRSALPESYGKNEVWVVQQLAKAYAGNNQKLEAKALIKSYLDRSDIDWSVLKTEKADLDAQLTKLE